MSRPVIRVKRLRVPVRGRRWMWEVDWTKPGESFGWGTVGYARTQIGARLAAFWEANR